MRTETVIISGAGPAGMMAAIAASRSEKKVILIERNRYPGRKLLLTGGGRCNMTNACVPGELVRHFSRTGKFLRDAFNAFDNNDLRKFFEKKGLKTKTEPDGRVFPATDKASSVLDLLVSEMQSLGVTVSYGSCLKKINTVAGRVKSILCEDGKVIKADRVILATGGASYKATGSTGDGICLAEKMGHTVISLRPGLSALPLKGVLSGRLEGISLADVKITFRSGGKKLTLGRGDVMFTRSGISGPIVLSLSAKVIDRLYEGGSVSMEIDMMPDLNIGEAEKKILDNVRRDPSGKVKNMLKGTIPARMAGVIMDICDIAQDQRYSHLTAKERKTLVGAVKGMRCDLEKSVSLERAQVTRGGVSVKEIDPRTMGSKKIQGLYFAGEMIDVDGECGGFNLQAAFSTGHLAGVSAADI